MPVTTRLLAVMSPPTDEPIAASTAAAVGSWRFVEEPSTVSVIESTASAPPKLRVVPTVRPAPTAT